MLRWSQGEGAVDELECVDPVPLNHRQLDGGAQGPVVRVVGGKVRLQRLVDTRQQCGELCIGRGAILKEEECRCVESGVEVCRLQLERALVTNGGVLQVSEVPAALPSFFVDASDDAECLGVSGNVAAVRIKPFQSLLSRCARNRSRYALPGRHHLRRAAPPRLRPRPPRPGRDGWSETA